MKFGVLVLATNLPLSFLCVVLMMSINQAASAILSQKSAPWIILKNKEKGYTMTRLIYGLFLASLCFAAKANEEEKDVKISKYRGGRKAALCLTFDDGTQDHLLFAAPMLEKRGFRGTFYIVTSRIKDVQDHSKKGAKSMTWKEVKELADRGHEIGNHSMTHYHLTRGDDKSYAKRLYEIKEPIEILHKKTGYKPVTFCYPGNGKDKEVIEIAHKYHIASRLKQIHLGGKRERLENLKRQVDKLIEKGDESPVMIHAIKKGYGWDPFDDISIFEEALDFLKEKQRVLWVDTFANLAKYRFNRENADLSVLENSPTQMKLKIVAKPDAKLYNIPTTIEIPWKKGVKRVLQGTKSLDIAHQGDRCFIDILPQNGTVTVDYNG